MPFVISVEGVERARAEPDASFASFYWTVRPSLPLGHEYDLVRAWRQLYGKHADPVVYGLVSITWEELESPGPLQPIEEITMTRERD